MYAINTQNNSIFTAFDLNGFIDPSGGGRGFIDATEERRAKIIQQQGRETVRPKGPNALEPAHEYLQKNFEQTPLKLNASIYEPRTQALSAPFEMTAREISNNRDETGTGLIHSPNGYYYTEYKLDYSRINSDINKKINNEKNKFAPVIQVRENDFETVYDVDESGENLTLSGGRRLFGGVDSDEINTPSAYNSANFNGYTGYGKSSDYSPPYGKTYDKYGQAVEGYGGYSTYANAQPQSGYGKTGRRSEAFAAMSRNNQQKENFAPLRTDPAMDFTALGNSTFFTPNGSADIAGEFSDSLNAKNVLDMAKLNRKDRGREINRNPEFIDMQEQTARDKPKLITKNDILPGISSYINAPKNEFTNNDDENPRPIYENKFTNIRDNTYSPTAYRMPEEIRKEPEETEEPPDRNKQHLTGMKREKINKIEQFKRLFKPRTVERFPERVKQKHREKFERTNKQRKPQAVKEKFEVNNRDELDEMYLHILESRAISITTYLIKHPSFRYWSKNWEFLKKNLDKTGINFAQLPDYDEDIAYSINKGSELKFRFRDKTTYTPLSIEAYVLAHEMAHMSTRELQHTEKFHELMTVIMVAAYMLKYIDLEKYPLLTYTSNGQEILSKGSIKTELLEGIQHIIKHAPESAEFWQRVANYIRRE